MLYRPLCICSTNCGLFVLYHHHTHHIPQLLDKLRNINTVYIRTYSPLMDRIPGLQRHLCTDCTTVPPSVFIYRMWSVLLINRYVIINNSTLIYPHLRTLQQSHYFIYFLLIFYFLHFVYIFYVMNGT